jgi:hypothetical protein
MDGGVSRSISDFMSPNVIIDATGAPIQDSRSGGGKEGRLPVFPAGGQEQPRIYQQKISLYPHAGKW